ncbi:unnamed protein product [Phyllotreta striolata]|uniref:ATP synthase subunit n=1 Tax=Phyllotreta striolata TaxID=444603 RepID=A0A9N9XK88_PHYSR|nr:unnamed protein product [Phyllotreta striolata]
MSQIIPTARKIAEFLMKEGTPRAKVFLKYAVVELTPPTPLDIPQIIREAGGLVYSTLTFSWRFLTVKEAFVNTLVATEVGCWFFVGECIGKKHIIGYKI